jgi:hypothetical protein
MMKAVDILIRPQEWETFGPMLKQFLRPALVQIGLSVKVTEQGDSRIVSIGPPELV